MIDSDGVDGDANMAVPVKAPSQRVLVALCTFNEVENIAAMIQGIVGVVPDADILVVDDDSPDGTGDAVMELGLPQVALTTRRGVRGLGGAIRHAMDHAVEHRYDLFCNLDADQSHPADVLPKLIGRLAADPNMDVAIASRYVPGGGVEGWPLHRVWMSRTVNAIARRWVGLPVRDASGSYRCYRVATLAKIDRVRGTTEGYAFLQEILFRLHDSGATMCEIPFTFLDRELGKSKLGVHESLRSILRILRLRGGKGS
ncbi:MAG: polyprenol monophosphomannose synthase [Planctomycetota bacterium]